jgi:hypothetical protein
MVAVSDLERPQQYPADLGEGAPLDTRIAAPGGHVAQCPAAVK